MRAYRRVVLREELLECFVRGRHVRVVEGDEVVNGIVALVDHESAQQRLGFGHQVLVLPEGQVQSGARGPPPGRRQGVVGRPSVDGSEASGAESAQPLGAPAARDAAQLALLGGGARHVGGGVVNQPPSGPDAAARRILRPLSVLT